MQARFRHFIKHFTDLIDTVVDDERQIFADGQALLSQLIRHDDWLPEQFATPDPHHYQQYLLYCDPHERFSVVSFVWGPGQKTALHDHTVWGMVGVMRGAELCEGFVFDGVTDQLLSSGTHKLSAGEIDLVSPRIGDIHMVSNALDDGVSISIHVYGANIGVVKRHVYERFSAKKSQFVSGYSNDVMQP